MTSIKTYKSIYRSPKKGRSVNRRYLGSKARLTDWICSVLGNPRTPSSRFIDVFSGTGIVSRKAAELGWPILANDHLLCAAVMTQAQLASEETIVFSNLGGYQRAIERLNSLTGIEGFFYREYSPSGQSKSGHLRYYFTPENAARIDATRSKIAEWSAEKIIMKEEEAVLIADLMNAVDVVANTAGTYGCFLKPWQRNALSRLWLYTRQLMKNRAPVEVHCADVKTVKSRPSDVAYIDPPYTKRQYAAYYHILETIAWGDEPEVHGVTGLRYWKDRSSDFCHKYRAQYALREVLNGLRCKRILLSYSSDGHLSAESIMGTLSDIGKAVVHLPKALPRYRANRQVNNSEDTVKELFFEVRR